MIKRERDFDICLPTSVSGVDARGREFQEQTELTSISAQEAIFPLDSDVTIGSKLNLCLEIPKTLILENHLRLFLSGKVVFIKIDSNNKKKQLILMHLDKKYKIQPLPSRT